MLKKNGKDLIGAMVAKEWLCLVKCGAWVFEGLLAPAQLKVWHAHVKYLELLRKFEITNKEFDELLKQIEVAHFGEE